MATLQWRLASSFPRALDTVWGVCGDLAQTVSAATAGRLILDPTPAGEPLGALAVLDALTAGEIAVAHTAGSFFLDRDPVLALATFSPFGLDARRQRAWIDGPGAPHVEAAWARQGFVAIPCGDTGAQTGGWYKRPLTRPEDFRGLRIRTAGLPALVLAELGAEPVGLPASEILPALQNGRLDAADWIGPHDDRAMGFWRAARFYHHPGVLEPAAALSLVLRQDTWRALPDDLKTVLRLAAADAGQRLFSRYDRLNPPALTALCAEGVELLRFPPAVLSAIRDATTRVLDRLAATHAPFAAALASYRAFAALGLAWQTLGEGGVRAAIDV